MLNKLFESIFGRAGERLRYCEQGRDGYICYERGLASFTMYWGFGGGNVLVTIDVPSAADWSKETGLPLAERDSVLEFVARRVIKDKTSSGRNRYEIGPDSITIYE